MSKRSNPLDNAAARKAAADSAATDSAAAEARFQAGRRRALAQMNAPEKKKVAGPIEVVRDIVGGIVRNFTKTGDAVKKAGK